MGVGVMMIVNQAFDPYCKLQMAYSTSSSGTSEKDELGCWTYTPTSDSAYLRPQGLQNMQNNMVLVVQSSPRIANIEWSRMLSQGDGWMASEVQNAGFMNLLIKESTRVSSIALFTMEDWLKVKAMYDAGDLSSPLFGYDTMPLPRN